MDADIALALEHHRKMNANRNLWARLDMIQHTPTLRTVRLYFGYRRMDGTCETAICTRYYSVWSDGQAHYYDGCH